MKDLIKLKTLVSFSFVIFFFPFLQTCSDKNLKESFIHRVEAVEAPQIDSIRVTNTPLFQTEIQKNNKKQKKDISQIRKENTVNFYELLNRTFGNQSLNELKSVFKDKTFYPLFGFLLIFIDSTLLLIFTFFNKYKLSFKLGILNFSLLILSTIGLFLSDIVEEINQFKIGYYLFALNSIFIILIAKKLKKQRNYRLKRNGNFPVKPAVML